uniref:THAP-type domain-containing protein n=1 Tax=Acanthochromis polyacanthus TaxID=80966 RepID=A0A3Q1E9C3_9TELE
FPHFNTHNSEISFHHFPKHTGLCVQWLQGIRRTGFTITKHTKGRRPVALCVWSGNIMIRCVRKLRCSDNNSKHSTHLDSSSLRHVQRTSDFTPGELSKT